MSGDGHVYRAPPKPAWQVCVEFHDGTLIYAVDDEDAFMRWRRLAAWTDPTAEHHPADWLQRVLERAQVHYQASLSGITPKTPPGEILDALDAEKCLFLRRR